MDLDDWRKFKVQIRHVIEETWRHKRPKTLNEKLIRAVVLESENEETDRVRALLDKKKALNLSLLPGRKTDASLPYH